MLHTSIETYESVLRLRTVRQFQPEQLAQGDIDQILQAARWTGSAKNLQLWSFIVIDDAEQQERLLDAGDFLTPIANAPMTIALVSHPGGYEFDMGRLAQNILLAAAALGVGGCPVTLHHEEVAHEVLAIPAGYRCRYAVALGYPDEKQESGARSRRRASSFGGRKPLSELVHHNRFGS